MAQYQVPQFLEVEDRIFGPLTLKQFLYSAGGVGLFFISYAILPSGVGLFVGLPLLSLFMAFAFFKYNNRPFAVVVESALKYLMSSKLYIWKKKDREVKKNRTEAKTNSSFYVPKLSESKLKDLSWELDVHDKLEASNLKLK